MILCFSLNLCSFNANIEDTYNMNICFSDNTFSNILKPCIISFDINNKNKEKNINFDVIFNTQSLFVQEINFFQEVYINLTGSELEMIYKNIDYLLQQSSNIYASLLYKICISNKCLCDIKQKFYVDFKSSHKMKIPKKSFYQISLFRSRITYLFKPLRKIKNEYIPSIKSEIFLHIPFSKIYFYIFVLDFYDDLLDTLMLNNKYLHIKYHYNLYIEAYKSQGKKLENIIKSIPLPDITALLVECIKNDIVLLNVQNTSLQQQLDILKQEIVQFYKRIEYVIIIFEENYQKIIKILERLKKHGI